jgi:hypothetical protein
MIVRSCIWPVCFCDLLKDHGAEEVRMVLLGWSAQNSFGHPDDVIPQRLPLVFFVPDVRALEQRDHKPLGLHEDHLRCTDLSLH